MHNILNNLSYNVLAYTCLLTHPFWP